MSERKIQEMTPQEFEALVCRAVRKELSEAGLRLDDPDHVEAAREDFRFLRKFRRAFNSAASKLGGAILLAIFSGLVWVVMNGLNSILPNK